MADCPFGVPWGELNLKRLEAFFAEADPAVEPLTWEAKGTELRGERVRREVCGFANQLGGFLVLGARVDGGRWVLDGVTFPGGEPRTWLEQVSREQLSPQPEVEAVSWSVGDGRHVAVLRVERVAVPPCLLDGRVYQRVSGRSEPIRDQAVLLDLTRRGEAAVSAAYERAGDIATDMVRWPDLQSPEAATAISLAITPVEAAREAASRVFRQSWDHIVAQQLRQLIDLPPPMASMLQFGFRHSQSYSKVMIEGPGLFGATWAVRSYASGSVGVSRLSPGPLTVSDACGRRSLGELWNIAAHLVRELEGRPPAALAISTAGRGPRGSLKDLTGPVYLPLPAVEDVDDTARAVIERDLLRRQGIVAHGPEPPADDDL
ncbi:MAG: helix-turn-helix domain-containing protein [Thermoleophilia bacterium]